MRTVGSIADTDEKVESREKAFDCPEGWAIKKPEFEREIIAQIAKARMLRPFEAKNILQF